MSPVRRLLPALLAPSLLAAALAGCAREPDTIMDRDAVLRLELSEYRISPQNIEVQATTVPMRIKIVARNVGRLTHTVKVERIEDDAPTEPDDEAVVPAVDPTAPIPNQAGNALPGTEVRSGDIMLEPGEYRLADTIGNHQNLGAYGTLTVLPPK